MNGAGAADAVTVCRLRRDYPHWDIRYHPANRVPGAGVFVACRVPAPETTLGLLAVAATSEAEMRRRLEIHEQLARRMAEVLPRSGAAPTEPEDTVARLRRQHLRWWIRYEADSERGRFVASRILTAEQIALGLLETVDADDPAELARRLAYQDALAVGVESITWSSGPPGLVEDVADLVAGCEELLRQAAENA